MLQPGDSQLETLLARVGSAALQGTNFPEGLASLGESTHPSQHFPLLANTLATRSTAPPYFYEPPQFFYQEKPF